MKTSITLPATKHGNPITIEAGKTYTTFTTDMRNETDWIFHVDEIDDNDRIHVTTLTGKRKNLSGTKRTQFTKNSDLIDDQAKKRIIDRAFTGHPGYFYQ